MHKGNKMKTYNDKDPKFDVLKEAIDSQKQIKYSKENFRRIESRRDTTIKQFEVKRKDQK